MCMTKHATWVTTNNLRASQEEFEREHTTSQPSNVQKCLRRQTGLFGFVARRHSLCDYRVVWGERNYHCVMSFKHGRLWMETKSMKTTNVVGSDYFRFWWSVAKLKAAGAVWSSTGLTLQSDTALSLIILLILCMVYLILTKVITGPNWIILIVSEISFGPRTFEHCLPRSTPTSCSSTIT